MISNWTYKGPNDTVEYTGLETAQANFAALDHVH